MPSHPPKWAQKALLHYFVLIKSVCRIIYFLNCTKLECIILGETTNFYGRTSVPLWISCLQENSSIWLSLFRWPLKLFHLWDFDSDFGLHKNYTVLCAGLWGYTSQNLKYAEIRKKEVHQIPPQIAEAISTPFLANDLFSCWFYGLMKNQKHQAMNWGRFWTAA